jgi:non-ribosomal peptide synthetase component F
MALATAAIAGTAAAAAYLDAKLHLRHDFSSGSLNNASAKAQKFIIEREKQGKLLLYNCLQDHAEGQPDRLFLEYENRSWTYKQFFNDLQRAGNWLMNDLGIQKGEMVALDGPNSAEYLMLWFALEGIGAGISFINCNLTGVSLTHSVKVRAYTVSYDPI